MSDQRRTFRCLKMIEWSAGKTSEKMFIRHKIQMFVSQEQMDERLMTDIYELTGSRLRTVS